MYYNHNTTISNYVNCLIEDGNIFQVDYSRGNKTKIGVVNDVYNDTSNTLDEYYNKLVELGVIEKEKTPEEKEADQMLLMKNMMDQMEILKNEIKELKTNEQHDVKTNDKTSSKNVRSEGSNKTK